MRRHRQTARPSRVQRLMCQLRWRMSSSTTFADCFTLVLVTVFPFVALLEKLQVLGT